MFIYVAILPLLRHLQFKLALKFSAIVSVYISVVFYTPCLCNWWIQRSTHGLKLLYYWMHPAVICSYNFYCYHQWYIYAAMNFYSISNLHRFACIDLWHLLRRQWTVVCTYKKHAVAWIICCVLANIVKCVIYTSGARWPTATYVCTHSTSVWVWYGYMEHVWCMYLKK